jgi:hypothetical protein
MARAVFQACPSPIDSCMRQVSIKKSNDRTFQMINDASSQTSCLPFSKPNVRGLFDAVFLFQSNTCKEPSHLWIGSTETVRIQVVNQSAWTKLVIQIYVPDGIVPVCQCGCLIQEGADNIDINTEIIDGKDTFHAMARAVFQARPSPIDSCMRQVSKVTSK